MVDDEQVIANSLAIILNLAGFEARAVFSGEQAIELLETFQPEMLIADVVMLGMTGIEAAIAIRNRLPKCNILLFSGQAATMELLEQARTQGHEFEILASSPSNTQCRMSTNLLSGRKSGGAINFSERCLFGSEFDIATEINGPPLK